MFEAINQRRSHALPMIVVFWILAAAIAHAATVAGKDRWNVLLITVDCMRPDHMSLYGYERDATPNLLELAKTALVFDHAFATSAWTSPGIVSLLTGYYPPVHAQTGRYSYYDAEMASPLRVLAAEGYDIFGDAIDGPTVENLGLQHELRTNVGKSWEKLENLVESRSPEDPPFFAWVHIKPTHLPYTPSKKNASRWIDTSRKSAGVDAVRDHSIILRPIDVKVSLSHYAQGVSFVNDDIPVIRALYDGEMADADERLGQVLKRAKENGLLDKTIVIITADHGEELFEHGWLGHASTGYDGKLYDELIRVPLIIRLPHGSKTGRYNALVQSVDVMPTIFDLLGIDAESLEPAMQGRSLMPIVNGKRDQIRDYVFNETTRKGWTTPKEEMRTRVVAVRSATQKLIRFPQDGGYRTEGYDLRDDPGEQSNIYPTRTAEFADLDRALQAWSDDNRKTAATLAQNAVVRHIANMERDLEQGDLLEAAREWDAIEVTQRTWGLEVDPFYDHEPYGSQWRKLRRAATQLLAQAMACAAEGGILHARQTGSSADPTSWACQN